VWVTKLVYWIEDRFEALPIHWMWWPAIGAVAVGVIGLWAPRTMGVGYDNIDHILSGDLATRAALWLCLWKLVSWSIALGSGTSGGTLAPLFTIGGGVGLGLGALAQHLAPAASIDPRIAALVGTAAIFAGASRALLASVVFAFETTRQPMGLLPLLGGCTAAFLVSSLLMRNTIMTEKLARRGARIPSDYAADFLDTVLVKTAMTAQVVTLPANETVGAIQRWLASGAADLSHQGFPVVDGEALVGVVTRRDLLNGASADTTIKALVKRVPVVISDQASLREAADHMVQAGVGRLAVMHDGDSRRLVGILTRGDILGAHRDRLAAKVPRRSLSLASR
jgi:CBS domain-containing protein